MEIILRNNERLQLKETRMLYQKHPRFLRRIVHAENKTYTTLPCIGGKNGGRLKMCGLSNCTKFRELEKL